MKPVKSDFDVRLLNHCLPNFKDKIQFFIQSQHSGKFSMSFSSALLRNHISTVEKNLIGKPK
jgi:hypothetical protein